MGKAPSSASQRQKVALPLGIAITPLATEPESGPPLQTVSFGPSGKIIRCNKCRTYVNPFVTWEAGGRRWQCNMCGLTQETSNAYYAPLDEAGRRVDRHQRPELSQGSVEFLAPTDYMVRPPMPPVFIILIDVSVNAVASGLVQTVCKSLKQSISVMEGDRTQISILTYDNTIHFYDLNKDLKTPQMLVVPDLDDVYVPVAGDALFRLDEYRQSILDLLDSLPHLWAHQKVQDSCLGSAIQGPVSIAKNTGGKILVFCSGPATTGANAISPHREKSLPAQDSMETKDMALTKPANDAYNTLASSIVASQISCDLFICSAGHKMLDLATWAPLASLSGGQVHLLDGFLAHTHGEQLGRLVHRALTQEYAWEAVMRIRVSRGWRIASWTGHFAKKGADLLVLPAAHQDQNFTIYLEMVDAVVTDPICYAQAALLYTSSNSERRIRVHTMAIPVVQSIAEVVDSVCVDALTSTLFPLAVQQAQKGKLADGRNYLQSILTQFMATAAVQQTPKAQALAQALPKVILGMMKSSAFRRSPDVTYDVRVATWARLLSMTPSMVRQFSYPRLLCLTDMDESQGGKVPQPLPATSGSMSQEKVYLTDDGDTVMIWIGRAVSPDWLHGVFGVSSLEKLSPEVAPGMIGVTDDRLGVNVLALLESLRAEAIPNALRVVVYRQGDANEYRFFLSLVEDRSQSVVLSLTELLQKVNPRVQRMPSSGSNFGSGYTQFGSQATPQTSAPYSYPQSMPQQAAAAQPSSQAYQRPQPFHGATPGTPAQTGPTQYQQAPPPSQQYQEAPPQQYQQAQAPPPQQAPPQYQQAPRLIYTTPRPPA
ncbi:MAG: uncharacterized protein KVP18_001204 [Porospora cf. gigantea A]|nr:MAG: hypothetical protein KVP18_001204 [Porospora cf. gigantea A]